MASDGEPVIDLRGKTARTSLPFSAGGMATLAEAGAGRGIGFGVGVGFGGGVALGSAESPGVLGVEATAGGGETGSSASGLAAGAELSAAELVESSRSSDWFLARNRWLRFLRFQCRGWIRILRSRGAAEAEDDVDFFWRFDSGGCAVSSLCVLRELSESSLIRDFGRDGSVGVARVSRFEEREFEGAGRLSGCDFSLFGCEASAGGASDFAGLAQK